MCSYFSFDFKFAYYRVVIWCDVRIWLSFSWFDSVYLIPYYVFRCFRREFRGAKLAIWKLKERVRQYQIIFLTEPDKAFISFPKSDTSHRPFYFSSADLSVKVFYYRGYLSILCCFDQGIELFLEVLPSFLYLSQNIHSYRNALGINAKKSYWSSVKYVCKKCNMKNISKLHNKKSTFHICILRS